MQRPPHPTERMLNRFLDRSYCTLPTHEARTLFLHLLINTTDENRVKVLNEQLKESENIIIISDDLIIFKLPNVDEEESKRFYNLINLVVKFSRRQVLLNFSYDSLSKEAQHFLLTHMIEYASVDICDTYLQGQMALCASNTKYMVEDITANQQIYGALGKNLFLFLERIQINIAIAQSQLDADKEKQSSPPRPK